MYAYVNVNVSVSVSVCVCVCVCLRASSSVTPLLLPECNPTQMCRSLCVCACMSVWACVWPHMCKYIQTYSPPPPPNCCSMHRSYHLRPNKNLKPDSATHCTCVCETVMWRFPWIECSYVPIVCDNISSSNQHNNAKWLLKRTGCSVPCEVKGSVI